jgi:acyl carrier protein
LPRSASGKIAKRKLREDFVPPVSASVDAPSYDSSVQERLAGIFKQTLKVSSVAPKDSFFELGGHSLLLLRLVNEIRGEFQCELPLRRVFAVPTLQGIAALITESADRCREMARVEAPGLVPLKHGSGGPSLYLICPAAGSAMGYLGLAAELDAFGSVWGLQAPGLLRGERPITSVQDLSERFRDQVLATHSGGRVFLGGWSFGGLVALELARQLNALNREAVVFLMDTEIANSSDRVGRRGLQAHWKRARLELGGLSFDDGLSYKTFRRMALWLGMSLPHTADSIFRRRFRDLVTFVAETTSNSWRAGLVFFFNWRASRRYRVPSLNADVYLLRTKCETSEELLDDPVYLLLQSQIRGHVEAIHLPGTHMTLFESRNQRALSLKLQELSRRYPDT